jgi:hypothetical protein
MFGFFEAEDLAAARALLERVETWARHYAGDIEAAGYQKVKDLYAWLYELGAPMSPTIEKLAARIRDRERITVRPLELGDFERLFPVGRIRLLRRKKIIDQARLLLLGVLAEYREHGLYPLLLFELHRQLTGSRYRRLEFSWVLEDNRDINQPADQAGATRYKTYRVYQKALS